MPWRLGAVKGFLNDRRPRGPAALAGLIFDPRQYAVQTSVEGRGTIVLIWHGPCMSAYPERSVSGAWPD
jgi:hypothetical protein